MKLISKLKRVLCSNLKHNTRLNAVYVPLSVKFSMHIFSCLFVIVCWLLAFIPHDKHEKDISLRGGWRGMSTRSVEDKHAETQKVRVVSRHLRMYSVMLI